METAKQLCAAAIGLALAGTLPAQSDLIYDGVDLTKMKADDALPLSSAKRLFDYREARKQLIPTDSAVFMTMPRNPNIPANIEEIYYANNWLEVSTSCWRTPPSFECYGDELYDADYIITDRQKGDMSFYMRSWHDLKMEPYLEFSRAFSNKPRAFGKQGKYFYRYYANAGNTQDQDYNVIVDYKDGLLILELTSSGKVGDFNTKNRFRIAYMAIPKNLMHSGGSSNVINTAPTTPAVGQQGNVSAQPGYFPVQPLLNFHENQFVTGEAAGTLSDVFQAYRGLMPDAATLKNMHAGNSISSNLEYDLYDYDWMELGNLESYNGEHYSVNQGAVDIVRFHPQAGTYSLALTPASGRTSARLQYLNNWNRNVTTVMRSGNFTYLANGNQPVMAVISYENNLLVVDEKDQVSGAVTRSVYYAVPKQF